MTGARCGQVTVLRRVANDKYGGARWECKCDCGKTFVTLGHHLRSGKTRSCGHIQRESASSLNKTHGMSKTALYRLWAGIKERCYNQNADSYANYGAKGITLCEEWLDFSNFYAWAIAAGYERGLTIERKDNAKGYCPENCCWASRAEQNRNTTRTHRIFDGERTITAAEAARIAGVNRSTVAEWCRRGAVRTLADVVERSRNITNGRHLKTRKDEKK